MPQEIIENGVVYIVRGDYPNGSYTKYLKIGITDPKTVYTKVDFLNKIPKALRKQIQAEIAAGTEDVVDWKFIVDAMVEVDLNNLPDGFVEGLDSMVTNPNINITQNQVDNFLER